MSVRRNKTQQKSKSYITPFNKGMIKITNHIKSKRAGTIKNQVSSKNIINSLKNKESWPSILEKRIKVNKKIIEPQSGHN